MVPARADWAVQSPIPTAHEIRGVAVPEADHIFLATEDDSFDDGGALFESTDGGITWAQRDVPASLFSDFHGVFFLDADHGWAWGNENYRTIDGGATWQPLPFLGSTYGMRFFSTTFGVATGNFGAQVSRDGGLTWEASPEEMRSFSFRGDVGLGASETGLHRTIDGGAIFVPVRPGEAAAVAFLSPSIAVAIVDDTFVRSADGGAIWNDAGPANGKSRLFAVSATVALAFGRTGTFPDLAEHLFRTDDGGLTWVDLGDLFDSAESLVGLSFASNGDGVLLVADGKGNLHRSIDGGATWSPAFATPGPGPGFLRLRHRPSRTRTARGTAAATAISFARTTPARPGARSRAARGPIFTTSLRSLTAISSRSATMAPRSRASRAHRRGFSGAAPARSRSSRFRRSVRSKRSRSPSPESSIARPMAAPAGSRWRRFPTRSPRATSTSSPRRLAG